MPAARDFQHMRLPSRIAEEEGEVDGQGESVNWPLFRRPFS
jgi:hypothetical protein